MNPSSLIIRYVLAFISVVMCIALSSTALFLNFDFNTNTQQFLMITIIQAFSFMFVAIAFKKLFSSLQIEFIKYRMLSISNFFFYFLLLICLNIFFTFVFKIFNIDVEQFQDIKLALDRDYVYFFISAVIIAPIYEEIFFRSFLLKLLIPNENNKIQIIMGSIFSSLLFSLLHLENKSFSVILFPIFILGIYFSYISYKHKNIMYSILLHSINNLWAFLSLYYIKNYS